MHAVRARHYIVTCRAAARDCYKETVTISKARPCIYGRNGLRGPIDSVGTCHDLIACKAVLVEGHEHAVAIRNSVPVLSDRTDLVGPRCPWKVRKSERRAVERKSVAERDQGRSRSCVCRISKERVSRKGRQVCVYKGPERRHVRRSRRRTCKNSVCRLA